MRRVRQAFIASLMVITLGLFAAASPPAGASPTMPPNPHVPSGPGRPPERCVDMLVLGFRGSGEHPRGRTRHGEVSPESPVPWQTHDFTAPQPLTQRERHGTTVAADRLGDTLGAFYEAVHAAVTAQGRTIGFWSVGVDDSAGFGYGSLYRAPPVDVANLAGYLSSISLDSLTVGLGRQLESLIVGTSTRPAHCPGTSLVVAGFSQGAVIARSLALNMQSRLGRDERAKNPVTDVVLIGDPLFRRSEHRTHGIIHPSDHQVDGLLRVDLARLCDRNRTTRAVCTVTAMGTGGVRAWFREVWQSMREFARLHPRLMLTSVSDLERAGSRAHVLCDSGDVVCSPLRVVSALRWDSDFPELLTLRPHRTIHGTYHRRVPWNQVAAGLATVTEPVTV